MAFEATQLKRILLTGGRSPCTLELARHLGYAGHEVIVSDTSSMHVVRFSNAIKKFIVTPSPRYEVKAFIDALIKIVEQEKIDLFIPMWEEVGYVSFHKDRFPPSCELFCSSFELVHALHNKWLFIKKLNDLGFKAPRSVLIHSQEDLENLEMGRPYILKACYSRGSRQVVKVETHTDLNIPASRVSPWIAQEYLSGKHYCSYSVCYQGKVLAHAAYPVVFTMDGHSCISFESVNHSLIFSWVQRFIESIGYTGHAAFDFIESPERGLFPIECNPRATSGIHLFQMGDGLERAFLHRTRTPIHAKPGSTQQIAAGMLMYGWKTSWAEGRFAEYFKKFFTTKDVIFCTRDLKPFLLEPVVLVSYWLKSKKAGISIPLLFTHDLDWNHGESIEKRRS